MSAIIVSFETSPRGANEPKGPFTPRPGPTLPIAVADAVSESSGPRPASTIAESMAMIAPPTAQAPT